MIAEASLQSLFQPKYIPAGEIEQDALSLLKEYNPKYLSDLDVGLDCYEFLFEFLPKHVIRKGHASLSVDFYNNPLVDSSGNKIVAFTEADKISVDRSYFDSDELVYNRICNFTISHEAYHAIKHRIYLKEAANQMKLFGKAEPTQPKLKRLTTLQRDLSGRASNKFCVQANMFASFFTMPRERVRKALLENLGRDSIELVTNNDPFEETKKIVRSHIGQHFEINTMPLAIALKTYGLVKEKGKNLSLFG